MVEWFSLLAVGTSMLGTLLSFSEFFKEQLRNIFFNLSTSETLQVRLPTKMSTVDLHIELQEAKLMQPPYVGYDRSLRMSL